MDHGVWVCALSNLVSCNVRWRTENHVTCLYAIQVPSATSWVAQRTRTVQAIRTAVSRFQRIKHEPFDIDACARCSAGPECL